MLTIRAISMMCWCFSRSAVPTVASPGGPGPLDRALERKPSGSGHRFPSPGALIQGFSQPIPNPPLFLLLFHLSGSRFPLFALLDIPKLFTSDPAKKQNPYPKSLSKKLHPRLASHGLLSASCNKEPGFGSRAYSVANTRANSSELFSCVDKHPW